MANDDVIPALLSPALEVSTRVVVENDLNATGLDVTKLSNPLHGQISRFGFMGPGTFVYTVTDTKFRGGSDAFTYCLAALAGGSCLSNAATITIDVAPTVPVDDFYSLPPAGVFEVKFPGILANDISVGQLNWTLMTPPGKGTLDLRSATKGGFLYTPSSPTYTGTDTFQYCLSQNAGYDCVSDVATVTLRIGGPSVSRIGGADRFEVATEVATQTHPATASVVYIASGGNYPDALSAAPAAHHDGGALLLTKADSLPEATKTALRRLTPMRVIIVGGPRTVSESVLLELKAMLPAATVTRISGADRFEVSRSVALQTFGTASQAIVATGANYPDALSSGGAAGQSTEPVVLVDGSATAADAATLALFRSLGTTTILVAGGPNSVSLGVEASLRIGASVTRAGGADRFEASVNINKASFATSTTAYLATGYNYPDALVGGVISSKSRAPLYVVPTNCVPRAVLDDMARIGVTDVVLLGGPVSLDDRVFNLIACP